MSTQLQQQSKTTTATIEYIPYGSQDKIKLNVEIIKNFVAIKTRTGKTCDDRQAMRFMMLCQAQHLNPFAGDAFLTGYDSKDGTAQFSLITAHLAFLKRAEVSPDFEGMESGIILVDENNAVTEREGDFKLPEEKVVGGWARVFRKGRKPTYRRLAIASMRPGYDTPFWNDQKAPGQIVKCAEADALRSTFPTLLGGLYNEGEIGSGPIVDITPPPNTSKLVEMASSPEPEHAPEGKPVDSARPEPSSKPQNSASAIQDELASIVVNAGYDFDQLVEVGQKLGHIKDVDSLAGFEDIPAQVATLLVRAKKGLLAELALLKKPAGEGKLI